MGLATGALRPALHRRDWRLVLLLGLLGNTLFHTLMVSVPVIATTIAVLANQETLTPSLVLGAVAVLGGVALTHRT